jgi:hypothetical protein
MKPFRIALLGDAMTAAWGPDCPELKAELSRLFARTQFEITNHAMSGHRAGRALWHITHNYENAGVKQECVSNGNYDLVIFESFAYTDCEDDVEGLSEYRDILRRVWEEIERTTAAKALFYITLPPERDRFGETAERYLNVSKSARCRLADRVRLFLDEAQHITTDEEWPTANLLEDVLKKVENGDRLRRYINQANAITPSRYGFEAAARVIVRAMDTHGLIKEVLAH